MSRLLFSARAGRLSLWLGGAALALLMFVRITRELIEGNTVHISSSTQSGVWAITVTDANHYQLTMLISGGYTPSVGNAAFIDLQTAQCTFNPSTVTPYLAACFNQVAGIMSAAGLTVSTYGRFWVSPEAQLPELNSWLV